VLYSTVHFWINGAGKVAPAPRIETASFDVGGLAVVSVMLGVMLVFPVLVPVFR
jgi:hypothetical protein